MSTSVVPCHACGTSLDALQLLNVIKQAVKEATEERRLARKRANKKCWQKNKDVYNSRNKARKKKQRAHETSQEKTLRLQKRREAYALKKKKTLSTPSESNKQPPSRALACASREPDFIDWNTLVPPDEKAGGRQWDSFSQSRMDSFSQWRMKTLVPDVSGWRMQQTCVEDGGQIFLQTCAEDGGQTRSSLIARVTEQPTTYGLPRFANKRALKMMATACLHT